MALTWLRQHGFAAPEPLACFEWRRFGFLTRATLLTEAFPGEAADQILTQTSAARRGDIARAIGRFVGALHSQGFRDRNLDLRNLLVKLDEHGITIAKIDSPRFRLVRPSRPGDGQPKDRLAAADWQRLLAQLAQFDVAAEAMTSAKATASGKTTQSRLPAE